MRINLGIQKTLGLLFVIDEEGLHFMLLCFTMSILFYHRDLEA